MRFEALIITNLPNYYKISLFNEIAKSCNIYVVFIANKASQRNDDFIATSSIKGFDYMILSGSLENKSAIKTSLKLLQLIKSNQFQKLILGEWVNIEYWFLLPFFRKNVTALMLESSIHSIRGIGPKEYIKKIFLSQVSTIFANGAKHAELAEYLNFKGRIYNSKGLGIINYSKIQVQNRTSAFLYIGRISEEKNLKHLIETFNELQLELSVVGEGPMLSELQSMSKTNISFKGYVNNQELGKFYKSHRALILISTHEPYGLVAEESLYFGTPVIASSVCGIVNTLCFDGVNSLVVEASSKEQIKEAIKNMLNDETYERLKANCSSEHIIEKNKKQVANYVDFINSGT